MMFVGKGYPRGGAWVISYKHRKKAYPTSGQRFEGIDDLKVTKKVFPETWDDFEDKLKADAWEILLNDLKNQ
jgi:hypothetical protein